jgi:hypothetical protein
LAWVSPFPDEEGDSVRVVEDVVVPLSFTFTDTTAFTSAAKSIPDPDLRMRLRMSLLTCTAIPASFRGDTAACV